MNSHDEIQHINKEQNALILHMQKKTYSVKSTPIYDLIWKTSYHK